MEDKKTPEQIEQEAAAAAAEAGQEEAAVVEAAAAAPEAGATQAAVEAVEEAAAVAEPEVAVELEQVKAKLKEYEAAVSEYTKAVRSDLSEEDSKLIDTLSDKDPVRWLGLYAKLKAAGKIGAAAKAQPSDAPEQTRVGARSIPKAPPRTPDEAAQRIADGMMAKGM